MATPGFDRVRRLPLRAALVVALLLLALAPAAGAIQAGDEAPVVEGPALGGPGKLSLGDLRGKVVYVDFWASWCAPCATALPVLDGFRDEFGAQGFDVFAVNVDQNPKQGKVFLTRRPVGYESLSDPKGKYPSLFGVETMPTSFLIDRKGVIRYVHKGFRKQDVDELRKEIRKLVAEK
jgi:thiol-disulfide isomerase/thioredoxin